MGCAHCAHAGRSRPRIAEAAPRRDGRPRWPSFRTSRASLGRNAIPAARLSGSDLVSAVAELSLKDRIYEILSQVPDPEIPCVSVVDLGIVREVRGQALVMTPTSTC